MNPGSAGKENVKMIKVQSVIPMGSPKKSINYCNTISIRQIRGQAWKKVNSILPVLQLAN